MNEKGILITLTLLLLVVVSELTLATSVEAKSTERVVGVEVGDWVKYGDFFVSWVSTDPAFQDPPPEFVEHNNTEWMISTVKSISGTKVTFQTVTRFKNKTETTNISYVDVSTGEGNGTFIFISANLNPGERIYNSTEHAHTWINQTVRLVYANAIRKTNYLKGTTYTYVPDEIGQISGYEIHEIEYFWDKATGVLSQRIGKSTISTEEYSIMATRSEVLIDTNLWEENPDTTPPAAEAGPDQTATVNQIVSFDAGSSSDDEGGWGIASYEWDFGDGTQGTGTTSTHAFNTPGTYTVTLTVEDWAGNSDKDTLTVTIQEASSPPPNMGVVILLVLLVAGLLLWRLKARK